MTGSQTSNTVFMQTGGLMPEVQDGLAEYYIRKLGDRLDVIHHDDMAKIAFYKTIERGFLALFLYDAGSDHFLFNEGYFHDQVRSLMKNYIHRLNENNKKETYPVYVDERLYNLELRLKTVHSVKYIFGAIVPETQSQVEAMNYLENFFSRYYFDDSHLNSILYEYNCLPKLDQILCAAAQRVQKNGQTLHYILIEIEPLKKYIKVAGDYLVNEIIKNVQETVSVIIKDIGQSYILNSRQYLITAVNVDEKIIKEKFGHAHFRIKNLLLLYQMKYYQVTDLENGYSLENAWPHLTKK